MHTHSNKYKTVYDSWNSLKQSAYIQQFLALLLRHTHQAGTLVHTVSQIVLIGGQNYLLDIQNM